MCALVRTKATGVWLALILATTVSWALGTNHGLGTGGHTASSTVILAVALFKVRLVGLWFMELRHAPHVLRAGFEVYCAAVCGLTIGMFLLA